MVQAGGRRDAVHECETSTGWKCSATRRHFRLVFVPRCTPRASRGRKSTAPFPRSVRTSQVLSRTPNRSFAANINIGSPAGLVKSKSNHTYYLRRDGNTARAFAGCHRHLPDAAGSWPAHTGISRMPVAVGRLAPASAGCHWQLADSHRHLPDATGSWSTHMGSCRMPRASTGSQSPITRIMSGD